MRDLRSWETAIRRERARGVPPQGQRTQCTSPPDGVQLRKCYDACKAATTVGSATGLGVGDLAEKAEQQQRRRAGGGGDGGQPGVGVRDVAPLTAQRASPP